MTAHSASKAVIVIGPPGAGKDSLGLAFGTQDYLPVTPGDMLRREVECGTEIGLKIKAEMEAGGVAGVQYVPQLVIDFMAANPAANYFFNGFPRNLEQAAILDDLLARRRLAPENIHIIRLDVSDTVAAARIARRAQEAANPRADDAPESVTRRLEAYADYARQLTNFYGARLHIVDGAQRFMRVLGEVCKITRTPVPVQASLYRAGLTHLQL